MYRNFFSILLLALCLAATPAHAASLDELLKDAIQDYQFQDNEEAKAKFNHILELAPGNIMSHYYLGTILMTEEKADQAIPHLEHVYNAPTPVAGIEAALAKAYDAAKKPKKALPIYKKLYDKDPTNDANAFQYAKALQAVDNIEQAKKMYTDLIEKKGKYADHARYQMGTLYTNGGSYATAVSMFKAIDPNSPYGGAAKQYMDALTPATKPISLYVSGQYFYNDNVAGSSSTAKDIGAASTTSTSDGGQGWTVIAALNTRKFEATEQLRFKLGYLFYGMLYNSETGFSGNDFKGHFINPSVSFHPDPSLDFELKGDLQYFDYNHSLLSHNYGATFTASKRFKDTPHSANINASYLQKFHTKTYAGTTSLAYLDANNYSFGFGGNLGTEWGGTLTLSYKFSDDVPTNGSDKDISLANKSRDNRSRSHTLSTSARIPFPEKTFGSYISKLTLAPSISYTKKNFLNKLTADTSYTDVQGTSLQGTTVGSNSTTIGIELSASPLKDYDPLKKYNITLATGYEHSKSSSKATSLSTKSNKYYGTLSASF
ncbi:MAG: tetratricopeptide repeat protein [Mariprofundaceae bacterium]